MIYGVRKALLAIFHGIKREAYVCSQYMEAREDDILIGKPVGEMIW